MTLLSQALTERKRNSPEVDIEAQDWTGVDAERLRNT